MKYVLTWIICGIIAMLLGILCDYFLYKQKPRGLTFILPLILGPITFYYLVKAIYYGLESKKNEIYIIDKKRN